MRGSALPKIKPHPKLHLTLHPFHKSHTHHLELRIIQNLNN